MYKITLTLDDSLQASLKEYTQTLGESVEAYLERSLQLIAYVFDKRAIHTLSDAELLAQTQLFMLPEQDERFSYLLDQQRESKITPIEQHELEGLLRIYKMGLWRKAQALAEAVQRGLIPALDAE